ncbi:MAG: SPASM domain-containing protein [Bacteroidales bacterium]|nr:SPASM domain-containing protein [Bacteroidales bacterium]
MSKIKQIIPIVMNNGQCKVPCFNSSEKTAFLFDIYKSIGKKYSMCDTNIKTGNCTAIYDNSFVIDPHGDIFKCWVDVGVPKMRIGTLKEGITNFGIVEKYMLSSDKFSDSNCQTCKLFPICTGGCNKYRMDSEYCTKDICPMSEDILPKFLV